jgi:hypothetical protein
MTSHQLARQLLDGPDVPVILAVGSPIESDTLVSDTDDDVKVLYKIEPQDAMVGRGYDQHPERQVVQLRGWMSSDE